MPTAALAFGAGAKSAVWRLDFATRDSLLLKVYNQPGRAAREQAAYGWLGDHSLPLPRMIAGAPATELAEHGWTMITIVAGTPLNQRSAELTRDQLLAVYRDVGGFLRRLHRYRAPAFVPRVEQRFARLLAMLGDRNLAERIGVLVDQSADLLAQAPGPVVCHGDLHAENIMIGRDARFTGAIDLESAVGGDPALDLVRLHHAHHPFDDRLLDAALEGYGGAPPGFDALFDLYFILCELGLWKFFAQGGSTGPLTEIEQRIDRRLRTRG